MYAVLLSIFTQCNLSLTQQWHPLNHLYLFPDVLETNFHRYIPANNVAIRKI